VADTLQIALLEPEIPDNAGAVARLCAATGAPLHLIGRLGFSLQHPKAKRAGMDYWEQVEVRRHVSLSHFLEAVQPHPAWMLSTHGERTLYDARFAPGAVLLFGPESRGLPTDLLRTDPERVLRIPMRANARSLNLATAVAIALYEGVRQLGFRG
jgi:tRNA (cytidine/uridine-2'-O-)-methyltransferase